MTPKAQLAGFLAKFTPEVAALAKTSLRIMRTRFPTAVQLVYDNYNFLVVGFGPTERPSEAIFSIALFARGVDLCFLQGGPKLVDSRKLLKGNGKKVRHIRLETAEVLNLPAVKSLMSQAVKKSVVPFSKTGRGKLVIRSISVKQRPRRPA